MYQEKDILADMHTHTVFSKHAYSTVQENIVEARKRGIKYLAITDHYCGNLDLLSKQNECARICYLRERVNPYEENIEVLGSVECNLTQPIFRYDKIEKLPWRPVGLHGWYMDIQGTSLKTLSQIYSDSASKFNSFNHIEREIHKIDNGIHGSELTCEVEDFLCEIVNLAKMKDIYLEVNESSLTVDEVGTAARLRFWLELAKENGNKICLGSDAHYCKEVGVFTRVLQLLNDLEYPKEFVLNCDEVALKKIFVD